MKQKALRATVAASILALAAGSVLFIAPAQAAGALTSAKQARAKALSAAPGTVLSVKKGTRSGYSAWAVSITRSDGSIVVGYVDVKNGIAFDWTVASSPGAPVIDLDGNDAALAPADPPKPPSETSSLSPVTDSRCFFKSLRVLMLSCIALTETLKKEAKYSSLA